MESQTITGHHYTTNGPFLSMKSGRDYGRTGLLPVGRFIKDCYTQPDLPEEAYDFVIQGLLEPEPESWTNNPEFPNLWAYLMNDIGLHDACDQGRLSLSFTVLPTDKAYVVERAHVERAFYSPQASNRKVMREAWGNYWESRVPVFDYQGGFSLPQLDIWSPIDMDRVHLEKVEQWDGIWADIKKNKSVAA